MPIRTSVFIDNAAILSTSDADAADHLREVSVVPEAVIIDHPLDLIRRECTPREMTTEITDSDHHDDAKRPSGDPYAALKERQ